jgi:hypothetical protein
VEDARVRVRVARPGALSATRDAPTARDASVINRSLSAAEEMSESQVLGSNAGFMVHVADDQSGVERLEVSNFPST